MANIARLAQIWLFLATLTCLTMAALALFSMQFFATKLAVPLATAIATGHHGTTLTLAGLVGLRCLAFITFLLASCTTVFALVPQSWTGSLATTEIEAGHSRGRFKVTTTEATYKTKNVAPLVARRYLAWLLFTTATISSVAYIGLLSFYILSNPAMGDCQDILMPFFGQLDQVASATIERNLKLATGVWFVGDVAVAGIGLFSTILASCKLDGSLEKKPARKAGNPPAGAVVVA